jgi:hypothetical protein
MHPITNISSIQSSGNQQNEKVTPVRKYDNKELALKGRFLMIVSFLTGIHSLGYLKLDKLPFIGGSVKDATPNNVTIILLVVLFYSLYRYWVYKRIAELYSSVDVLSKKIRDKVLLKRYKRVFVKAYAYLLSNGDLTGFDYELTSPDQYYNNSLHPDERGYISPYDISYWRASYIRLEEPKPETYNFYPTTNRVVQLRVDAGFGYIIKSGSNAGCTSQTSNTYTFDIPFSEYLQLRRKSDLKAAILLPDFLEKLAPYIASIIAITIGAYTIFTSP